MEFAGVVSLLSGIVWKEPLTGSVLSDYEYLQSRLLIEFASPADVKYYNEDLL